MGQPTAAAPGGGLAPGGAEGTGLANLRQSLQLAFGAAATLTLAASARSRIEVLA